MDRALSGPQPNENYRSNQAVLLCWFSIPVPLPISFPREIIHKSWMLPFLSNSQTLLQSNYNINLHVTFDNFNINCLQSNRWHALSPFSNLILVPIQIHFSEHVHIVQNATTDSKCG